MPGPRQKSPFPDRQLILHQEVVGLPGKVRCPRRARRWLDRRPWRLVSQRAGGFGVVVMVVPGCVERFRSPARAVLLWLMAALQVRARERLDDGCELGAVGTRSMWPPLCSCSANAAAMRFMMRALTNGIIGSSVPATINVCCRTAGQREQLVHTAPARKLVQVTQS